VVTIVKISGDKVRIGIEAPGDVLVLRDELETRHPGVDDLAAAATESAPPPPQPAAAVPLRQSA